MREKLANNRTGITRKAEACGSKFYITVNFYEDGRPSEVFIAIAKRGSTVSGFCKCLFVMISVALQSGVPWETIYTKLRGQKFEPYDDEYTSLVDAMVDNVNEVANGYG